MKINVPFGSIWLDADDEGLSAVSFFELANHKTNPFTELAAKELTEYFAGQRTYFTVPLSINRGTQFQRQVWRALSQIPFGETRSYLEIAQAVDSPKAVRAIGQANSKNPFPIIVPCHRVIGKNGKLTGYLGSSEHDGLSIKKFLLKIENVPLDKI
ncbi:methylated-DNA-[protein]-cysteine S-methyltransferase [Enterococcus haemoperoxidus ATCC BAA-382]|uniref:Methylated-DNA--protein-cysteine methyltransferase n=1 Tax=Enterococcus haemoperoxidus ATCC BAA-382 TaxID=1158608 RepID=R2QW30_9ENTE|nr:methylated-DNA--[protein]-cysteine S-methyltransferase [Enterococcus haemoperoxidus]EOH99593.1 methylated-DNA-[protein]-cysteine S-methyltransferase [Enterococcus haemoperoxidus ATCC BAA-382]EOT62667.1 methylated-DNA-protein-cysteine methyltransferase [Enterococcus haemoperoxidus ATCC BAA-382]OJG55134.1 methylated-DNA-[protein]-cysteine S-methyltransferase [Enterococcus haemoperoxidus]